MAGKSWVECIDHKDYTVYVVHEWIPAVDDKK